MRNIGAILSSIFVSTQGKIEEMSALRAGEAGCPELFFLFVSPGV